MRILSTVATVAALIALGACTNPPGPSRAPTDVGSMSAPSGGGVGVVTRPPSGPDVGSMSAPSGSGGAISRTTNAPRTSDTGSMALPSNAQGNSAPRP